VKRNLDAWIWDAMMIYQRLTTYATCIQPVFLRPQSWLTYKKLLRRSCDGPSTASKSGVAQLQ
jgi:hypothetical protein